MNNCNCMSRFSTVLMVLVAATFATGCADRFVLKQVAASAKNDLNGMNTDWKTKVDYGSVGITFPAFSEYTNTSYLVSDVHYAMVSPAGGATTTGETTAVAVKDNSTFTDVDSPIQASWNRTNPRPLKVLEFGAVNTPTSTENLRAGGVGQNAWAVQLEQTRIDRDLAFRNFGSIKDAGNDSILGWGRWTDSRFISAGVVVPGCCSENKSAHYVFGAATPNDNIPASGTATFNLIAATAPTLISGTNAPGTLSNTSQVGVSWGGATTDTKIGISLQGSFTAAGPVAVPFSVTTAGGAADPLNGGLAYDAATRSFGGIITGGSVSGFIAGPQATHVGLTYDATIASPQITGIAQGAAAFKR